VNENHAKLLSSPDWAAHIQQEVLPLATAGVDLGDDVLELGPGPCAVTSWLHARVPAPGLVAVEQSAADASALAARLTGVTVECGDATALRFADASFNTVVTCTMLHHIPTRSLQDRVLAEAFRVLRPGGAFLGSDSLPSDSLHHFHEGDVYNPIEPASFLTRLQVAGFATITLRVGHNLIFTAWKAVSE
jgi:ubiquinone/menaquinone biosynthesis C-methylase UbiE